MAKVRKNKSQRIWCNRIGGWSGLRLEWVAQGMVVFRASSYEVSELRAFISSDVINSIRASISGIAARFYRQQ